MPTYSELDSEFLEKISERLVSMLRTDIRTGLKGLLRDDKGKIHEVIKLAIVVGWEEGFIDRSGACRVEQLTFEGELVQTFRSVKRAANFLGVAEGSIQDSIRHKNRYCKGYKFRFKKSV